MTPPDLATRLAEIKERWDTPPHILEPADIDWLIGQAEEAVRLRAEQSDATIADLPTTLEETS